MKGRSGFLVFAATALTYLPLLKNGFVDWDDSPFILKNAALARFDVGWMFTANMAGHYHPLTWLSLALDRALWGPEAWGVHLTSLLLHAGAAVLFYQVALRLLGKDQTWPAVFAALFFSLHPLRVESVAWAIERRDVLSGFFYLWTVKLWLDDETRLAPLTFAASLLSKGIGVTLPLTLALIDVSRGRKLDAAWARRVAPYAALSLIIGAVGFHFANRPEPLELGRRLAIASYGLCFYPLKTLWPSGLIPLYPLPQTAALAQWPYAACAAAVGFAAALLVIYRRRFPKAAAGAVFYAATLFPVLGFFHFGPQLVADRYSYLSCLPLALLAAAAFKRAPAVAAVWLLFLTGMTMRQSSFWRSSQTLWSRQLAVRPADPTAHHFLASAALGRGSAVEAERHERLALASDPKNASTLNGLGLSLAAQRRFDEALSAYDAALAAQPDYWEASNNKGLALGYLHRFDEASAVFDAALARHPEAAGLHGNYALTLLTAGKKERGIAELETALRLDPSQRRLAAILTSFKR